MSTRELVILGTASQVPTRARAHHGALLRWDDEVVLLDPGEGTQRQLTLAGVPAGRITRICLTHLHGDHLRHASVAEERLLVREHPGSADGLVDDWGSLSLHAAALDHRIDAYGWRLQDPDHGVPRMPPFRWGTGPRELGEPWVASARSRALTLPVSPPAPARRQRARTGHRR